MDEYGDDATGQGSALASIIGSLSGIAQAGIYASAAPPSTSVPYSNNYVPLNAYGQPLATSSGNSMLGIIFLILLVLGGYFFITKKA